MKKYKWIFFTLIMVSLPLIKGCDNEPLLTEMKNGRLIIIFKGTYATNNPKQWDVPGDVNASPIQDDSVAKLIDSSTVTGGGDEYPTALMLDIGKMEMVNSSMKRFEFSNYRQALAFGLNDSDPFFNGAGVILDSDDVPYSTQYPYIALYIRKMLFDSAMIYTSSGTGWDSTFLAEVFNEKAAVGFNFNQYQINSIYDVRRYESYVINRVYPLLIPIKDPLIISSKYPVTVLEVRFIVKNYIKKYELATYENGIYRIKHFYAMSDWRHDIYEDETSMGSNIIAAARYYWPGATGSISGTASVNRYVIAVPAGQPLSRYTMPEPTADSHRKDNPCDIPTKPSIYFGSNIDEGLNYYLKYEKFKKGFNDKVTGAPPCDSFDTYKTSWDSYRGNVKEEIDGLTFPPLMPLLATYTSTNNFTLRNVMPGSYDIYVSSADPEYGTLLYESDFGAIPDATVAVTTGQTANTGPLP